MTSSDDGRESGPPDSGPDDLEDIAPAEPQPVTDEMITPRTAPAPADAGGEGTRCHVCGEANHPEASYCLACGVRLTDETPEPWVDDDFSFDHDAGFLDPEQVEPPPVASAEPTETDVEETPRDTAALIRRIVTVVVSLIVVFLLVITFRPSSEPEETTTTTSADQAALETYAAGLVDVAATVTELRADAATINQAWDDRTEDYDATLTALTGLASRAAPLSDLVLALEPPASVDLATHQRLVRSAADLADAAQEMVDGLQSTDTGEARRAALDRFDALALEFGSVSGLVVDSAATPTTSG